MSSKKSQESIAAEIVAAMNKTGVIPWSLPIHRKGHDGTPHNLASENPYSGGNIFVLNTAVINGGYKDNFWLTSRQIRQAGGRIRQGEFDKAVKILKYLHFNPATKELLPVPPKVGEKRKVPLPPKSSAGLPEFSERMTTEDERWIPLLRTAFVYNPEQAEGEKIATAVKRLRAKLANKAIPAQGEPFDQARKIVAAASESLGVTIEQIPGSFPPVATFDPQKKKISITSSRDCVDSDETNALWFKEVFTALAHASGEKLARPLREGVTYGNTKPGYERLVAEMSASMTLADLEIPVPRVTDAKLAAAWAAAITSDPGMLFAAHRQALKTTNFIVHGVTPEQLAKVGTKQPGIAPETIVEEAVKPSAPKPAETRIERAAQAPAQTPKISVTEEPDVVEPQTCIAIDYYLPDEKGRPGLVKTAVFRNDDPEKHTADEIGEVIYETTLRAPDGGFNPLAINLPSAFKEGAAKPGAAAWHILKDVREVVQKPNDSRSVSEFKKAWLAIGANWQESASVEQTVEKAEAVAKVAAKHEAEKSTIVRVSARNKN